MRGDEPANRKTTREKHPKISFVVPVLPGQAEAWRRFVQELRGPRRDEWIGWRARAGLKRLRVWARTTAHGIAVLIQARFTRRTGYPASLLDEKQPFDRWLREQLLALHGLDIAQFQSGVRQELIEITDELDLIPGSGDAL